MVDPDRRIRAHIDTLIAAGALAPGDRLPAERRLAERLDVPRSAVRRVLATLERQGRVVRVTGSGTRLAEPAAAMPSSLPATSPGAILQARATIEPSLAALAARAADSADAERLQALLRREVAAGDFGHRETSDALIHRAVAAATHNSVLITVYDVLDHARDLPIWESMKRRSWTPQLARVFHREHADFVAAICAHDPRAAHAAMAAHIRHLGHILLLDLDDPFAESTGPAR